MICGLHCRSIPALISIDIDLAPEGDYRELKLLVGGGHDLLRHEILQGISFVLSVFSVFYHYIHVPAAADSSGG